MQKSYNNDEDEYTVPWEYVPYLLNNLSSIKHFYVKILIGKGVVSQREDDGHKPSTCHAKFSVQVKDSHFFKTFESQINYFSYKSKEILTPYIEITLFKEFLDFLEEIFDSANVFAVLKNYKSYKKSELNYKEVTIVKITEYNTDYCVKSP